MSANVCRENKSKSFYLHIVDQQVTLKLATKFKFAQLNRIKRIHMFNVIYICLYIMCAKIYTSIEAYSDVYISYQMSTYEMSVYQMSVSLH